MRNDSLRSEIAELHATKVAPLRTVLPHTMRANHVIRQWYAEYEGIERFKKWCIQKGVGTDEVDAYINRVRELHQGKNDAPATHYIAMICASSVKVIQDTGKLPKLVKRNG